MVKWKEIDLVQFFCINYWHKLRLYILSDYDELLIDTVLYFI